MNRYNSPFYESVATTGIGVQDTLKAITKLVLLHLTRRYDTKKPIADAAGAPAPVTSFPPAGGTAGASSGRSTAFMGGAKPATAGKAATDPVRPAAAATAFEDTVHIVAEESEEEIIELTDEYEEPGMAAASATVVEEEVPIELEDEIEEDDAPTVRMPRPAMPMAAAPAEPPVRPGPLAPPRPPLTPPSTAGRAGVTNGGGATRMASRSTGAAVEDVELTLTESDVEAPSVRLTLGEQHLSIPVEMEVEGQVRRFTLSIRLDLRETETGP